MSLCYVNYSSGWGGLEMYSADLFGQVLREGYDVDFFVEHGAPLMRHLERAGCGDRLVPRRSRKYFDPSNFRALKRHVRARDVRLVHTFRSADIFHSVLGTRGLGAARPALLHHLQMLPHRSRRDFFHSRVYAHLDRVLTITEQMRASVIGGLWPVAAERVETLYYGLDLEPYDSSASAHSRARAELGLTGEVPMVGLVGQICEIKGQRFVLDALAPWIDAGELELVLVGQAVADGAGARYERDLRDDVARLKRPGGVHLVGFREDIARLLPAFDVFVLGSSEEPFGRVVIEALAAGCLTVGSRAGGVPEIIDDGVDGWLYRARDREDLRAVLARVLALGEEGRRDVRTAAAAKVAGKFSLRRHLDEIERIYGELTGGRALPAAAEPGGGDA